MWFYWHVVNWIEFVCWSRSFHCILFARQSNCLLVHLSSTWIDSYWNEMFAKLLRHSNCNIGWYYSNRLDMSQLCQWGKLLPKLLLFWRHIGKQWITANELMRNSLETLKRRSSKILKPNRNCKENLSDAFEEFVTRVNLAEYWFSPSFMHNF